ncbi:hypothetical protein [Cutibacterium sp.]|uniref:hypothetical protein n=1 Tax=Cutibacterium sp. TaxID=1912221 RepID=UPI0026DD6715|nr:hypothetical protein [Cutibacterium sp.]MDO4412779.1 hypothetical protein [Cutibacterium sp.]
MSNKEGPASSSSPELDPNIVSKQKDYADPTARNLVKKEMRLSDRQATNLLSDKIPLSLNLETSTQPLPDDLTSGISVQDKKNLNSLPNIDSKTGRASIPSPKNYEMFSIQVKDQAVDKVIDGVARTQDNKAQNQTTAVSHITANQSGQIIGIIKDTDVSFMDFSYMLPDGYRLQTRNDGDFNLVSEAGEVEGEIEAPWALDASGKQLPTRFELVDDHTLRQHVDTEGASFPIALDPSWAWWLVTAGKCAVSVAPLLATGGSHSCTRTETDLCY